MLLIRGKKISSGKSLEWLTKIYRIPPKIVEGWENSNGPLQVIDPLFFPFPSQLAKEAPGSRVGHLEAAGPVKAMAQ